MDAIKQFNEFFHLYHRYNNWGDLYAFTRQLQNPLQGTIPDDKWGAYRDAMGEWCRLQYAIWMCGPNIHKDAWDRLQSAYAELCRAAGIEHGKSILRKWGIEEEDEDSDMPHVFDIVYATVVRNAARQETVAQLFENIRGIDTDKQVIAANTNGKKLREFIEHYKSLEAEEGRHKLIKFLIFKKVPSGEQSRSLSLATTLEPILCSLSGKNKVKVRGIWDDIFKPMMTIKLFELPGPETISRNYLMGMLSIKFSYDRPYHPYMWSNLFDEDILLRAHTHDGRDLAFSPATLRVSIGKDEYERSPFFNYSLHLSEIFDRALLSCGKRSFIPFDIGDIWKVPDDAHLRFLFNESILVYIRSRGHDTEAEHLQSILVDYFRAFAVVRIVSEIEVEALTGDNPHAIPDIKAELDSANREVSEVLAGLDLNTKEIHEYLSGVYPQSLKDHALQRLAGSLEKLAYTDNLTQLGNRNLLDKVSIDKSGDWTGFCIDIDHFKKVNDTYGHDTGDIVLQEVSHIVKSTIKKESNRETHVFRLGGEEIGVLTQVRSGDRTTKDEELAHVVNVAEQIRKAIELYDWKKAAKIDSLTVSIGVSGKIITFPAVTKPDFKDTFGDAALYLAKQQGRNRVVVSQLVG